MLRLVTCLVLVTAGVSLAQSNQNYQPVTAKQRTEWFVLQTAGPESIAGGAISAGWGTLFNKPSEYGAHWDGFGKRYGMRLTGVSVSNAMEAGLGAVWGEDPRYQRSSSESFGARVGHIVKMTFIARNRSGGSMPAYARYAAISGNNFLSNAWRADSQASVGDACLRIALGFVGRMSSNAFREFWPDVRQRLSRKESSGPPAR